MVWCAAFKKKLSHEKEKNNLTQDWPISFYKNYLATDLILTLLSFIKEDHITTEVK